MVAACRNARIFASDVITMRLPKLLCIAKHHGRFKMLLPIQNGDDAREFCKRLNRQTALEIKFFAPRKKPIENVINVLRSHIERNLAAYEEDMTLYSEIPEEEAQDDLHYHDDEPPEPPATPQPEPEPVEKEKPKKGPQW